MSAGSEGLARVLFALLGRCWMLSALLVQVSRLIAPLIRVVLELCRTGSLHEHRHCLGYDVEQKSEYIYNTKQRWRTACSSVDCLVISDAGPMQASPAGAGDLHRLPPLPQLAKYLPEVGLTF